MTSDTLTIFETLESEVRGYCRSFPTLFTHARGAHLTDVDGREYIDFLAGAGTLNYGHNHPAIKGDVIRYLQNDGLLHGLDMHTQAKAEFLETFQKTILQSGGYDYRVQFTGPTGTNAVEAAFKLARKVTGRTNILSFTNGFHGVSLGSVAATGNSHFRNAAGVPLGNTTFVPYDGYLGDSIDTIDYIRRVLEDTSSGIDMPAAVVVETVQGEGGINIASAAWLRSLEQLCRTHGILLILDDIQMGCGRTGDFFSFRKAGISPDFITLSKSLSGIGLPMALLLMRPEHDQWKPGEHNGTFRGNNLAFVSATAALKQFWTNDRLSQQIAMKGRLMRDRLLAIADAYPDLNLAVRGRGMVWGIACAQHHGWAQAVSRHAFDEGLIIETSGTGDHVLKFLPPLTIDTTVLEEGLDIVERAVAMALSESAFIDDGEVLSETRG